MLRARYPVHHVSDPVNSATASRLISSVARRPHEDRRSLINFPVVAKQIPSHPGGMSCFRLNASEIRAQFIENPPPQRLVFRYFDNLIEKAKQCEVHLVNIGAASTLQPLENRLQRSGQEGYEDLHGANTKPLDTTQGSCS